MGLHYLVKKTHVRILPLAGVTLLLWVSATLNVENRDAAAPAHHTGCQFQGKPDQPPNQTSCIVDLRPGHVRLFAPSVSPAGKLHRWLDLQAASVPTQYVFAKTGRGVTAANQQRYQVAVRGRLRLDAKERVAINAGLYSGATFIAGFNNTGLGMGEAQSNLYLKHLYLSALPLDRVEVQYGSLDVLDDESTDITGYAYNGYVAGEWVSIKRPSGSISDSITTFFITCERQVCSRVGKRDLGCCTARKWRHADYSRFGVATFSQSWKCPARVS
jgi:hypothetical protein